MAVSSEAAFLCLKIIPKPCYEQFILSLALTFTWCKDWHIRVTDASFGTSSSAPPKRKIEKEKQMAKRKGHKKGLKVMGAHLGRKGHKGHKRGHKRGGKKR